MKNLILGSIPPSFLSVAAAAVLVWFWIGTGTGANLVRRDPGLDKTPPPGREEIPVAPVPGTPIYGEGKPSKLPGRWPWFRGKNLNATSDESIRLARTWPAEGPPVLWTVKLGEGYAGAAVSDGCVYVLDYDADAQADTLRCLSLDDGREIWRNGYPISVARNHGMSRTVPAVVDGRVITLGPQCQVACWDARTGACYWLIDLRVEQGTTVPQWYAGQCPLIDGDRLILAPCGEALLTAVDFRSGEVIWKSPNPRRWKMTHSSITPMEFAGRRMYVYCGTGGVAGVSAEDGALLWDTTDWAMEFATSPSPVVLPGGRIFLSCGYRATGAIVLQLKQEGDAIRAETVIELPRKQFGSEQQTPILYKGHLYGVRKQGGQLVCLDLDGNEVWSSRPDRFGNGPYMIADGLIFVMNNTGRLTMAEAMPQGYKRLGQFQVFENGVDAWGPMALVGGRLIVRDMTRMSCLDVAEKKGPASE